MPQYLLSKLQETMQTARDTYGVDPVVFLVIYLACAPLWYFSLFRTLRALGRASRPHAGIAHPAPTAARDPRRMNQVMLWSAVFLAATVAPFVYVMLFGRNIPWWVYVVIVVLVGQGVLTLVRKLRSPSTAT